MPEMQFAARWPDGTVHVYYSPSLVVADYLRLETAYALGDFIDRARTALRIASERVLVKFGYPCPRAARSFASIEAKAREFAGLEGAIVFIEAYGEVSS